MHFLSRILPSLLALSFFTSVAAQEPATNALVPEAASEPLIVAVREVPPFAMKDSAGNWEGLSVDLWQDVADKRNLNFEWKELPLSDTLTALQNDGADVAIAALTVTTEREQNLDFTHPYYVGGLALGHTGDRESAWLATLRGFVSVEFLSTVASLALVLLIAGFAVWLFERRANKEEFGGGMKGLGAGFWWSAVTMTTVGYGDKSPKTLGGRVVALVWMFTSLIIIAGFTATIAASLTTHRLGNDALENRKLSELKISVLSGSNADNYATNAGAKVRRFSSLGDALSAVENRDVDAVIHDAPILQYHARTDAEWLIVSEDTLVRDDYSFGLRSGSPLREELNTSLLSILHEPVWQNIRTRYLGQ